MDSIASENSEFVSQYSAGSSFQNRDLRVIVIKAGSPAKRVWIDCGIHAREWISPATCVNLINKVCINKFWKVFVKYSLIFKVCK
jgi:hypothetical protein